MEYRALNGNLWVTTSRGGHGGLNVQVDLWDDDTERWVTGFDKLVFADSLFETLSDSLAATGFDYDRATDIVSGWGIELPDDSDEE